MSSPPMVSSEQYRSPSSISTRLSSQEVAELLLKYGPNDPTLFKRGVAIVELLLLFLNPLVIIFLVASLVSFLLGDATDAVIILVILLVGVSINFFQPYRSRRPIDKLKENVTPTATVLQAMTRFRRP